MRLPTFLAVGFLAVVGHTQRAFAEGACCFSNGACVVVHQGECDTIPGGNWRGERTSCSDLDENGIVDDCTQAEIPLDSPKIYWMGVTKSKILRANLDFTNIELVIIETGRNSWGLTVDPVNRKLYWVAEVLFPNISPPYYEDFLFSANLDGSGVKKGAQMQDVTDFTVDPLSEKVYWGEGNVADRQIFSNNFDGSEEELLFQNGGVLGGLEIVYPQVTACGQMDSEGDGDIDLRDFAVFQNCMSDVR